jgi:hypothetical protein
MGDRLSVEKTQFHLLVRMNPRGKIPMMDSSSFVGLSVLQRSPTLCLIIQVFFCNFLVCIETLFCCTFDADQINQTLKFFDAEFLGLIGIMSGGIIPNQLQEPSLP